MYHYARYRMDVTRVAQAILADDKEAVQSLTMRDIVTIQERLYEHLTGKRPIKADEWLNEELKRETSYP